MNAHTKERLYRYSVALAMLYALLALRYLLLDPDVAKAPYLQSLTLGWGFAVTAVVASILPSRIRPPHLN